MATVPECGTAWHEQPIFGIVSIRRVRLRLAMVAAACVLTVALTACYSNGDEERPATAAQMLKGLKEKYADRPWTPLIREVRYVVTTEGVASWSTVTVLTAIDASDGLTPEERQYASEICLAIVGDLPHVTVREQPWQGVVKASDGTTLQEC